MDIAPYCLLALTSLFWSFNVIIGKILSVAMPPATINFFRWLLPFVILFLWNWKEIREQAGIYLAKWPLILFLGATDLRPKKLKVQS